MDSRRLRMNKMTKKTLINLLQNVPLSKINAIMISTNAINVKIPWIISLTWDLKDGSLNVRLKSVKNINTKSQVSSNRNPNHLGNLGIPEFG